MIEPITEEEINEFREKESKRIKRKQSIKNVFFLCLSLICLIIIIFCVAYTLEWYTIDLFLFIYISSFIQLKYFN